MPFTDAKPEDPHDLTNYTPNQQILDEQAAQQHEQAVGNTIVLTSLSVLAVLAIFGLWIMRRSIIAAIKDRTLNIAASSVKRARRTKVVAQRVRQDILDRADNP